MWIDGEWRAADSGAQTLVHDPATGIVLGSVPCAGVPETDRAIRAAARAWRSWRERTPDQRGEVLRAWAALMRRALADLALLMTREQGKPLAEARGEIEYAAGFLDWFAEEGRRAYGETIPSHRPGKQLLTVREPVGIVGAITPWNFPSAMITRKAAAALAAGCPIIVKPANETPFSAVALAVLAERAGVPRGIFQVVTGDAREIAGAMAASPEVRALSFTGSTEVGRALLRACAETVKRVSMELGGHAPFIVFDDVAVDRAVDLAMAARFQTSGQDCLAANRILVHRPLYAAFLERFTGRTRALRVGSGLAISTDIGPLISRDAVARCVAQVMDARSHGARVLHGGGRHAAGENYMEPTVLADVTTAMRIWREETFGPVAAISAFDSVEEAIVLANDTSYGLAAYVCTNELARSMRLARELQFGMVAVNTASFTGAPIPFGGVKQSGLGREGSRHGLDEFTDIKYICLSLEAA